MAEKNNKVLKNQTEGYGYTYTSLADIQRYCDMRGIDYQQKVGYIEGKQHIITIIDGVEYPGAAVVTPELRSNQNSAQRYGAALSYARRYSLLMALGLACGDDDEKEFANKNGGEVGKWN